MLENIDRKQLIKWVAYYLIVAGILTICSGIALTGVGGLAGMAGIMGAGVNTELGDPELAAATAGLGAISALTVIIGIASIVAGPAMAVVGWGLLQKKPWARMGTVIVVGISLVVSVLTALGSVGLLQIAFIVLDVVIIYLFLNDPRIKAELGG
jgi:hypothetical protein